MWQQIKAKQEKRAELAAKMRGVMTKSETEKRDMNPAEVTEFDTIEAEVKKLDVELGFLVRAYDVEKTGEETRATLNGANPGKDAIGTPEGKPTEQAAKEYRAQLGKYLRGVGTQPKEFRALTIAGQGVVGDRPFYNQLVTAMKFYNGVRQAGAEVIPTETGNPMTIPTADDTGNTGQLVGEGVTDNTAADPALGNATLGAYKFDSKWIKVSMELLQDNGYDLESKINGMAGERIGRSLNTYTTTGTGSGQPTGFMVTATLGKTAASATAFTYDELLDTLHSVDVAYRSMPNFGWQLADPILAAARKLKDGNGRYIWLPGEAGQPDKLLGYKYTINSAMDSALTTTKKIVSIGDFGRYALRDVTQIYIVRADELFIGDGLIGYRMWARHDGILTDAKSVKYLQLA